MSAEDFWILGHQITGHKLNRSEATGLRRFKEFFGACHITCSIVWEKLSLTNSFPASGKPCHLLWALLFLKRYLTEHVLSSIVVCRRKNHTRDAYTSMVQANEMTVADEGYRDRNYFIYNKDIMARHETVNRRLKQFSVLNQKFRHQRHLHPQCLHAVANLTQLMIANGERLYDLDDSILLWLL